MSVSIADLKAKQSAMLAKIKEKADNTGNGDYGDKDYNNDERFWKPTFDPKKGASATIQFLPGPNLERTPYAKVISHFFSNGKPKGQGAKWYVENSRRSINEKDPVADLNARLYATGLKSDKNQCSRQKQRHEYFANILVLRDRDNPENEGKVFLYKFGKAVWNLIEEQLFPNTDLDPDAVSRNPFNVLPDENGEPIALKLILQPHNLDGNIVPNYDKCAFVESDEIEDLEDVINKTYDVSEFDDDSNFKSYKELADKLIDVLGYTTGSGIPTVEGASDASTSESVTTSSNTGTEYTQPSDDDLPFGDSLETSDDDDEDDEIAALRSKLAALED